jgi:hypothetical protein
VMPLKSGWSLEHSVSDLACETAAREHALVLGILAALELLALGGDVHPEAALPTY